ncbi:MAG: isoprenylcysteine carboxylmethyltransferase family protein [Alphaproteobacteria bacterium]|nr:isoprenylcysteine carboxylmethyltransferase family protein [Alphaproteobacteria bacterium]MCW5740815.1 isoprenylcysteine carboxylmethyltransferase family protein [Alphaproteobacteria bacterium]
MLSAAILLRVAWALWGLSWIAASLWSARSVGRAPLRAALANRVVTIIGAILLFGGLYAWPGAPLLWSVGPTAAIVLGVLMVGGFAFAWWARLHLGRYWSSGITRKEGHRIVDTGPYGLTRHPIYTGLIWAALAMAVAEASLPAVIGGALFSLGLWLKATAEETFLSSELGAATYDAYRRRVPMLVPFMPTPD